MLLLYGVPLDDVIEKFEIPLTWARSEVQVEMPPASRAGTTKEKKDVLMVPLLLLHSARLNSDVEVAH